MALFTHRNGSASGSTLFSHTHAPGTILDHHGNPFRQSADRHDDLAVPHVLTFSGLMGSAWRTYFHEKHDEALKHSRENARAMLNDCFLMRLLDERRLATLSLKWHIEVDDEKSPGNRALKDGLTKIVKAIPGWIDLLDYLLWSIWYGRYGSQLVWQWKEMDVASPLLMAQQAGAGPAPTTKTLRSERKRVLTVKRHVPIHGDKIGYKTDGVTPYVLVHGGQTQDLPHEPAPIFTTLARALPLRGWLRERFVIHRHRISDADYFEPEAAGAIGGIGIRSVLYFVNELRNEWLAYITDWIERAGLGVRLWYYKAGDAASRTEVEKAAKANSRRTNILVPRTEGDGRGRPMEGVEWVDTQATGSELLLKLIEHLEDWLELYVIGQSMSTGADTDGSLGGTGKAMFAKDTKSKLVALDAQKLAETITTDILTPIHRWSFPEIPPEKCPARFVFEIERADPQAQLDAVSKASSIGVTFPEDRVRELTGVPAPDEGDRLVGGKDQAPGPGGLGGSEMPGMGGAPGPGGPGDGPPDVDAAARELFGDDLDDGDDGPMPYAFDPSQRRGQPQNAGQFGPGGQAAGAHQSATDPHSSQTAAAPSWQSTAELHQKAEAAAMGIGREYSSVWGKLGAAGVWLKDKTKAVYQKLESRYGRGPAVAIFAAGHVVGLATPLVVVPGSTIIGMAPFAAMAEVYLMARAGVRKLAGYSNDENQFCFYDAIWQEEKHPRGQPGNAGQFGFRRFGGADRATRQDHNEMSAIYKRWAESRSEEELDALERYGTDSYLPINESLRDKDRYRARNWRSHIRSLDKAIAEAPPLQNDTIVFRGMPAQVFANLNRGDRFLDRGFVSTSVSKDVATYFSQEISPGQGRGTVVVIKVKAGTKGAYIDAIRDDADQAELILPRGSIFRVLRKTNGRVFVRLEQAGSHGELKTYEHAARFDAVDANEMVLYAGVESTRLGRFLWKSGDFEVVSAESPEQAARLGKALVTYLKGVWERHVDGDGEKQTQGRWAASGLEPDAAAYEAAWDESKHPRGQPENAGQFGPGGSTSSSGGGSGGWGGGAKSTDSSHGATQDDAPIKCGGDIKLAARLLAEGKRIELSQPEQVATLLDELNKQVQRAVALGEKAPAFDLCKITLPATNLFCQDTIGVPRAKMPQMRGFAEPGTPAAKKKPNAAGKVDISVEFLDYLESQGIGAEELTIRASHLRASQDQIDGARVAQLISESKHAGKDLRKRPIFVTRDNYVLDGHHHWAALVGIGYAKDKDLKVPVYRLDMEIGRGIHEANGFAKRMGLKPKTVATTADSAAADSAPDAGAVARQESLNPATADASAYDEATAYAAAGWDERKHPRGQPQNAGQFGPGGSSRTKAAVSDKTASAPPSAEGKVSDRAAASVGTIKPSQQRAFAGDPVTIKAKISKQEAGAIGEEILIQVLKLMGRKDARHMNLDQNNFPVDLIQDHELVEAKTGMASNSTGAQQWRLTIGEPGNAEKEWLANASPEEKAEWNAKKQKLIHERKKKVLAELQKKLGKKIKTATMTVILDTDRKIADVYRFEGWHDRIGWNSEQAETGYVGSYAYGAQ